MSNQNKTVTKIKRLFVLSFESEEDRTSYFKYYTSYLNNSFQCID